MKPLRSFSLRPGPGDRSQGPESLLQDERAAYCAWGGTAAALRPDPKVARSPVCTGPAQWSCAAQAAWSSNTQAVGVPCAYADRMELTNSDTEAPGSGMNPRAWASSVHSVPIGPPKRWS